MTGFSRRIAYAAAHVVPRAQSDTAPDAPADLDWQPTADIRHRLWSYGFGVAEAMDTAQRGAGLNWDVTQELIARTAKEAESVGGAVVAGVGTDQLPELPTSLADVEAAYREQLRFVLDTGVTPVVMASRQLARAAHSASEYLMVYQSVLAAAERPVILHWLGEMFDPALAGYWGSRDVAAAADTVLDLITSHADVVEGIKVSLLDVAAEQALRSRLPDSVRLYTGDDFNYPELILGDGTRHSDALLGVFAAIAPAAATALRALDADDVATYSAVLAPTVPLARHLFAAPTRFYKTGIAFISWLNGWQSGFTMIGGATGHRSPAHLLRTYQLAVEAGVLVDPDLAAARADQFARLTGVTP